jgi:hypothetical protein
MADERALLVEFCEWIGYAETWPEERADLDIDAFLAARAQPEAPWTCNDCHRRCQDEHDFATHSCVPAPPAERFWRVESCNNHFGPSGHHAWVCDSCGVLLWPVPKTEWHNTIAEAVADGERSGLPAWKGGE